MSRRFPLASAYTFSSAALWLLPCVTTFAQDSDSQVIEEVTVTALKRETLLQKTPLSLLAVSGLDLVEKGIDSVADLLRTSPGLTVLDQGPSQRRLVIRGIQSAGESQVGLYYDEAPLGGGAPSTTNDAGLRMPEVRLFDVDRIEVLRGPQGTLFGAGSMAGTVRVIFNKPSPRYAAVVDGSYETVEEGDASYQVNGMVNLPIVDGLAMRAVMYYRDRGGYVDNLTLRRDDLNEEDSRGGRVMVRYAPTAALTLDVSAHLQRDDGYLSAWELPAGEYNTAVPTQLPVTDDFDLYNLTLNWDLGFATLTGVSSLFERDLLVTIDASRLMERFGPLGAPFRPAILNQPQDIENLSHELRLSSNSAGALTWTAGAYWEERDAFTLTEQQLADPNSGLPFEPRRVVFGRTIQDVLRQRALFGELSYDLTAALNLTVGGRYFDYDKSITGETKVGFALLGAPFPTPPATVRSDDNGWVSKVNLSYKLGGNALVYAQASEGFRSGGANQILGLPTALTPYDADSLWNYEIGAKTSWFDDRLVANAAVFRVDWQDMQVTGQTPNGAFNFISNAGEAQIDGVELEARAQPVRGLELMLSGAYLDARLSEDQVSPDVNAPGRKGDRIPNVSKYSAAISAAYEWPLGASLLARVRGDVNYVGSSFSELRPNNPFNERIDAYTLAHVRLGVESIQKRWAAYLFVNNVFDEVAIGRELSSAFGTDLALSAPPRTVGVNIRQSF